MNKDLSLLSNRGSKFFNSPLEAKLEVFDNKYPNREYKIEFNCPEFTSLCPVTGQPDFGEITILYIPDKKCIESKSLKLYLFSYRNFNTFHEEVVNRVLDDCVNVSKPIMMEVFGRFRPRGGISLNISSRYNK